MRERSNYLPPGLHAGGGYGRPPRAISLASPGITNFERYPRAVHAAIGCVVRASRFNNGEGDKSRWELAAAWQVCNVLLHLVAQEHPSLQDLGDSLGVLVEKEVHSGRMLRALPASVFNGIRESSAALESATGGATVDSHVRLQEAVWLGR